jgi:hypothetical protein
MVMARWFFVNGFAWAWDATRCSGSAGTAIAVNATAAPSVAIRPDAGNAVVPTAVINRALKDGSTTATDSGSIGDGRLA